MSKLLKRKVFYVQVHLASPLSVSSGEQEWTDSDVLRDAKGNPFVAGSSIAGAMRAYLEKEKNQKCKSKSENTCKSHNYIHEFFA